MSGAIPLLPLYAFLAWTGTTFLLTQYIIQDIPESGKVRFHPVAGHTGPERE